LDRELPTTDFREVAGVIQTDAAINPGNSGGPLLDSAGRLIGVNTAIRSASGSSAGVGFAIPVDLVNRIVPVLIARGRAPLPGIGITPVRPDLVARAGIAGVVIARVGAGTPAAQAGLRPIDQRSGELGDVIVAVNGRRVETLSTFVAELDRVGIDNTTELTVERDGKQRRVRVKVIDLRG
jgi:2-alkenal reductase